MKTHARDYLVEFAQEQESWLKALVYEAIETNGDITEDRFDQIYSNLINEEQIIVTPLTPETATVLEDIKLINLHHKQGIQALKENQTVKFSDDVTVLYGLNGAGKSSYFKVLNEVVGGNHEKEIHSNIYKESEEPIVEIKYKEGSSIQPELTYDGTVRSFSKLNKSKVFDTSYLNGLLDSRSTDDTLVEPLGLNLFTYIIATIDNLKSNLKNSYKDSREQKPTIDFSLFSDQLKHVFINHDLDDVLQARIESKYSFSKQKEDLLIQLEKDEKELTEANLSDKIKLEELKKTEFKNLINELQTFHRSINEGATTVEELILDYNKKHLTNKAAKKQLSAISDIPEAIEADWKAFIKAGNKYSNKLSDSTETCSYCKQPLVGDALELVQAYSSFLTDTSEKELSNVEKELDANKLILNNVDFKLVISEQLKEILLPITVTGSDKNFIDDFIVEISKLEKDRDKIIQSIKDKKVANVIVTNIDVIETLLSVEETKLAENIEKLKKNLSDKQENLEKLSVSIALLKEHKSIANQELNIKEWIRLDIEEMTLRKFERNVKSNKLSSLSDLAHEELLTETLKTKFENELRFFGLVSLEVILQKQKVKKGQILTELTLRDDHKVRSILSEGEQKSVALALFLAEAQIQEANYPIILDDPVNSLDHKIAAKFVNRLFELNNQIIVFTHNRLFLDAFETHRDHHICKNFDSCCNPKGKHVRIYNVSNEGKFSKGILSNYKTINAKTHLKEVKNLLNRSPFNEEVKVAALLRKAVECCIDEKVFNRLIPTKYSNKNENIKWVDMKAINIDPVVIDELNRIHGRVSGGELHNGTESSENPIEKDEFDLMLTSLEGILEG